jgi:hypothetical protein
MRHPAGETDPTGAELPAKAAPVAGDCGNATKGFKGIVAPPAGYALPRKSAEKTLERARPWQAKVKNCVSFTKGMHVKKEKRNKQILGIVIR